MFYKFSDLSLIFGEHPCGHVLPEKIEKADERKDI
jgi:hypothetical protein